MGSNLALTRRYGRATPGARVHDAVPGDPGGNVSTIGALDLKGIRTGLSVPGAIDGETMVFFVEELLAPTLKRGELVFMDNCLIHKLDEIEDLVAARGAGMVFLPAYSPDLNPIEHCWSKVKARLRALKPRTPADLLAALVDAFATVTGHDMRGWFRTAGIRSHSLENRYNGARPVRGERWEKPQWRNPCMALLSLLHESRIPQGVGRWIP